MLPRRTLGYIGKHCERKTFGAVARPRRSNSARRCAKHMKIRKLTKKYIKFNIARRCAKHIQIKKLKPRKNNRARQCAKTHRNRKAVRNKTVREDRIKPYIGKKCFVHLRSQK
jgi:hypothetical protein